MNHLQKFLHDSYIKFQMYYQEMLTVIAKALGLEDRICFDEFVKRSRFDANLSRKRFLSEESKPNAHCLDLYYKYMKAFTIDASKQWLELTEGVFSLDVSSLQVL